MLNYKTDRPNYFYSWRQICLTIIIISIPILFDLIFPTNIIKDSYLWIALGIFLARVIDETNKERLSEIYFNVDDKLIIFSYKTLLSGQRQKTLKFENAVLEIVRSKPNSFWGKPLTLYFLKNKMEVFEITKCKDGYSISKLEDIIKAVERLTLPTSKA
ncbi:MAG: hypothetical protein EOO43_12525 [Flavobacterium sp.]|nr:MAG: hypothetical protein EOO43_12525 [Flavobacterium sp.]